MKVREDESDSGEGGAYSLLLIFSLVQRDTSLTEHHATSREDDLPASFILLMSHDVKASLIYQA